MDIPFKTYDYEIDFILILTLTFYYIYYYFSEYKSKNYSLKKIKMKSFLIKKFKGFVILGIIPGIFYYLHNGSIIKQFGLSINNLSENFLLIIGLAASIGLVLFINQKNRPLTNSLQVDLKDWNLWFFTLNAFGWLIYLSAYEFLFRGILLFECTEHFGFSTAIVINCIIYSAIHMVYGKEQAIGALFFGALSCFLTLKFGTLYIPFFMHLSLSLFSDFFSIKYNPTLKFVHQVKNKL